MFKLLSSPSEEVRTFPAPIVVMVELDERPAFYRRRPWFCCCSVFFFILLLVVIILVILAFTVFKPKDAEITESNFALQDFHASLGRSGLIPVPSVNVTLSFVLTVHNPNRASIKISNSSAIVYYHDDEVAVVPIPASKIGSQDMTQIPTTIVVLADQLVSNSHLLGDLLRQSLPFVVQAKLSGRVKVLFITKHIDISSQCSVAIAVANATISSQDCNTKVHL